MLDIRSTFDENGKLVEKLFYKNKEIPGVKKMGYVFFSKKKEGNLRCLAIQMSFEYAKEHKLPALNHIITKKDLDTFITKVVKREG